MTMRLTVRRALEPSDQPLSRSVFQALIGLVVVQVVTLLSAVWFEYEEEHLAVSVSLSCGVVGFVVTGYGFVQTLRWLMRQS